MLRSVYHLENPIQPYAWGSRTAIPEILGLPTPSATPAAELWMGAHPKAQSKVLLPDGTTTLGELIQADPVAFLGRETVERFGPNLPYLFKILAAAAPLSIQAHPNRSQAKDGFERENRIGIPMDAPERNYKDPNSKPECICAITPFWAMRGFRDIPGICDYLKKYCPETGHELGENLLKRQRVNNLRRFFEDLMRMTGDRKQRLIEETVASSQGKFRGEPVADWVVRLSNAYPGDIGVLSPLFLNTICLNPGEAMFLPAGELHAYLEGVGIELMANSDNVLRGGLTPKHVAVDELIRVLTFSAGEPERLTPRPVSETEAVYPAPADAFRLSVIRTREGISHQPTGKRGGDLLLLLRGEAVIHTQKPAGEFAVARGQSVFIPAATGSYAIEGDAEIYRAGVPIDKPGWKNNLTFQDPVSTNG